MQPRIPTVTEQRGGFSARRETGRRLPRAGLVGFAPISLAGASVWQRLVQMLTYNLVLNKYVPRITGAETPKLAWKQCNALLGSDLFLKPAHNQTRSSLDESPPPFGLEMHMFYRCSSAATVASESSAGPASPAPGANLLMLLHCCRSISFSHVSLSAIPFRCHRTL